jgi:GntR family transcriptional repressor for pyruvate dehydrogenase complex
LTERNALPDLGPIERRSVSDEIVFRLGDFIVQRGLRPGEKLPPERELMEVLRVGRSSLREAIKALRAVGAIEVVGGGGMYVGRGGSEAVSRTLSWAVFLNSSSIRQAIEARELIEVELAALAAERITDDELVVLHNYVADMRAAARDPERYLSADIAFHLAIAAAARNDILYYALEMLQHVLRAWIRKILRNTNGEPVSLHEHVEVYEALAEHDPGKARHCMKRHISAASLRLMVASPEIAAEESP